MFGGEFGGIVGLVMLGVIIFGLYFLILLIGLVVQIIDTFFISNKIKKFKDLRAAIAEDVERALDYLDKK